MQTSQSFSWPYLGHTSQRRIKTFVFLRKASARVALRYATREIDFNVLASKFEGENTKDTKVCIFSDSINGDIMDSLLAFVV